MGGSCERGFVCPGLATDRQILLGVIGLSGSSDTNLGGSMKTAKKRVHLKGIVLGDDHSEKCVRVALSRIC